VSERPEYAVFCGIDVGKGAHHAVALDVAGKRLHDKELPQDEAALRAMFQRLLVHGPVLVVVDQPNNIGALAIAVARDSGCQVAYLPGLAMRRIAGQDRRTRRLRHRRGCPLDAAHPAPRRYR
jgi:hypothetical protein